MIDNKTTKHCPKCNNINLLLLRTFNLKICTDCDTKIPWFLEAGQKSIA